MNTNPIPELNHCSFQVNVYFAKIQSEVLGDDNSYYSTIFQFIQILIKKLFLQLQTLQIDPEELLQSQPYHGHRNSHHEIIYEIKFSSFFSREELNAYFIRRTRTLMINLEETLNPKFKPVVLISTSYK